MRDTFSIPASTGLFDSVPGEGVITLTDLYITFGPSLLSLIQNALGSSCSAPQKLKIHIPIHNVLIHVTSNNRTYVKNKLIKILN